MELAHESMCDVIGVEFTNYTARSVNYLYYYTVAQLVEALCYKPKGRGFNSR
jgi:hypothetical protein